MEAELNLKMKLDADGFIPLPDGKKSNMMFVDEGELFDIMMQRFRTRKWYIFFFPLSGFERVTMAVENKFYTPGTDRNKGYEIVSMMNKNTTLVMCYKPFMPSAQLTDLLIELGSLHKNNPSFHNIDPTAEKDIPMINIPEDKDVAFVGVEDEPATYAMLRITLFQDFLDYCVKQATGT